MAQGGGVRGRLGGLSADDFLPLPVYGERSIAKRSGEGDFPLAITLENPPHPNPLPASGAREPTFFVAVFRFQTRPRLPAAPLAFRHAGTWSGIHVFLQFPKKTWMAGTSPAMTTEFMSTSRFKHALTFPRHDSSARVMHLPA